MLYFSIVLLTLFLLNNLLSFLKYFHKRFGNSAFMFVQICLLNGLLYQIMKFSVFMCICLLVFFCVFNLVMMFTLLHCVIVGRGAFL